MSPKGQVYLFAILFALTGLCLTIYKTSVLHFPLLPSAERKVWSIEAKIAFDAIGDPVSVNFALPEIQQQFSILDEVFASAGYGFSMQDGDHRLSRPEDIARMLTALSGLLETAAEHRAG